MIAIIGASGQFGTAVLDALISYKLAPPESIIAISTAKPGASRWNELADKGVDVRHGNFEDAASLEAALKGAERFLLVSSPYAELDFNDAPEGQGREKHHKVAIDAARAAGVKHIVYTSLAFGNPSKAGVQRAHVRTEKYLATLDDIQITVARDGLYNESWPLYLGYYDIKTDERTVVPIGGDGKVCWTDMEDLGLANALILTDPIEDWAGKTIYLSTPPSMAKTISEIAELVAQVRGRPVKTEVVGFEEHVRYYVEDFMIDPASVKWWVTSFEAIADGETLVDDPTLVQLLERKGKKPKTMEETIFGHNPLYDAISSLRNANN